ncbi:MAG: hypothetical protein MPW15_03125 [Candidatus Manganitrophus sp.]|nr:hypothetical protein [Candidatus Manganitrophus sp.]
MPNRTSVWMSHGDRDRNAAARVSSDRPRTDDSPVAAMKDPRRNFYAVQFHPEVVHTPQGAEILPNFLHHIAGCKPTWDMRAFRREAENTIRAQVGAGQAICGLSGGVDSSVAAVLVQRGDRRSAHLRLRRQRPAAEGRGEAGPRYLREQSQLNIRFM